MRFFYILGALLSATAPALAAACNADNCFRAVFGAAHSQTAQLDCSSLIACTATAAPVTTTITQTVEPSDVCELETITPADAAVSVTATPSPATTVQTVTPAPMLVTVTITPTPRTTTVTVSQFPSFAKRQARCIITRSSLPATSTAGPTTLSTITSASVASAGPATCGASSLPTYAGPCSGTARYVSACSCGGVMPTTTTVPGSTITVTATATGQQETITSAVTLPQQTSTTTVTLPQQTTTVTVTAAPATSTVATTLVQQTATSTVVPAAPSLCGNGGLQWAYYPDTQEVDNTASFAAYNPTVIKSKTPTASGFTAWVGVNNPGGVTQPIYGSSPSLSGMNYILSHRGYLYAPESGTYKFHVDTVDDIVDVWLGPLAYAGWTRANVLQEATFEQPTRASDASMKLTAGAYYPFRLEFKQGMGGATFRYSLTSPSGKVLLNSDSSSQPSPYIVQYSCDRSTAPPYAAFGKET